MRLRFRALLRVTTLHRSSSRLLRSRYSAPVVGRKVVAREIAPFSIDTYQQKRQSQEIFWRKFPWQAFGASARPPPLD